MKDLPGFKLPHSDPISSCHKILKEAANSKDFLTPSIQGRMNHGQNTEWSQLEEKYQKRVLRVGFPLLLA